MCKKFLKYCAFLLLLTNAMAEISAMLPLKKDNMYYYDDQDTYEHIDFKQPTILEKADEFPHHIRVHIGYLKGDKVANPRDTAAIITALNKAGKTVECFENTDTSLGHGHLGQSTGYQLSVRTFLDNIVKNQHA